MVYEIFANFFQLGPLPANQMVGTYDFKLVILSFLVACLASYIALDITGRLRDINNTPVTRLLWVVGGSIAMGAGIWSMHFIGMLAFSMNMPLIYRTDLTILSMLVAIGASMFALSILKTRIIRVKQMALGGIILGLAIAAMHYTGMAAMSGMEIHYVPSLFFLSIVIAILASEAALYLALKSTQVIPDLRTKLKIVSAFVMGAAICGMHYTGMAAAIFTHIPGILPIGNDMPSDVVAISVAGVTFFILAIAFLASIYKESLNQQLFITARQAGVAEVAASVLHNIGNVLNSVNVSSSIIEEKLKKSKLTYLADLKKLLAENDNDLEQLLHKDEQGKNIVQLLISLSEYWENERNSLINETTTLTNNVEHIKAIIATQQDMSKTGVFRIPVSLKNIINEAILITGVDDPKYNIQISKVFEHNPTVVLDKVKLLQILINIVQNSKDALLLSKNTTKIIKFTLREDADYCYLEVYDNGVGIPKENQTKIFSYGFTTKTSGHGFGLHSSAISATEMGGALTVKSEGENQGASFILKIPHVTTLTKKAKNKSEEAESIH